MPGWRRSADRTRLHLNSLLTGNFTGKFRILGLLGLLSVSLVAVPQQLSVQFPKRNIREKDLSIREFLSDNRES
jgi:hypothetical protein